MLSRFQAYGIITAAKRNGPVAQWQSSCLLSNWLCVRVAPGSPSHAGFVVGCRKIPNVGCESGNSCHAPCSGFSSLRATLTLRTLCEPLTGCFLLVNRVTLPDLLPLPKSAEKLGATEDENCASKLRPVKYSQAFCLIEKSLCV